MRTRRSPRNQERLWRALGAPKVKPVKRTKLLSRAEVRAIMFYVASDARIIAAGDKEAKP